MRLSRLASRAALLGFVGVAACDVYAIATDPFPGLVQSWTLPTATTRVSVASLLPAGVSIFSTPASNPPDSSAFLISMPGINYSRPLAPNCSACVSINGTTAAKPAFNIGPGDNSASHLPTDVLSGTVVGATITYTITNGFNFDPLRVRPSDLTQPQGWLIMQVVSASQVIAKDSINGATTPLPAGSTLTRTMNLASSFVEDSMTVQMLVNSPAGDPVFMDANLSRTIGVVATITGLRVANVRIRVPGAPITSGAPEELPIDDLDESFTERAISGGLELTVTNPFAVAGNIIVNFATSTGPISKPAPIAAVTTPQRLTVPFDSLEMSRILTSNPAPTLAIGGSVSAQAPITVTPKQVIQMSNRLLLKIRAFGGTD